MSYYSSTHRTKRKYIGTPQWTLDQLYITPFTHRRRYDEDGNIHLDPIARNLAPTGLNLLDQFLRRLAEGNTEVNTFCASYGLRPDDLDSLLFITTGMTCAQFRRAYQFRQACDLLRYTSLPFTDIARRTGLGSHTNLCVVTHRERGMSPTELRLALRQQGDEGRFRL